MEKRGQRLANRVANYAKYASGFVQLMRPVKVFQFVQGDLPGSGGLSNRRICQRASRPQGQYSCREADLPHWHNNQFLYPAR
jgi:hypothetical protein